MRINHFYFSWTLFFQYFLHCHVNLFELMGPVCFIEQRTHVKSIIITSNRLVMKPWGNCGHFMSVVRVRFVEMFDFFSKVFGFISIMSRVYGMEHCDGAKFVKSSHLTKQVELLICQSHIFLVILSYFSFQKRLEFGSRGGIQDI